jgi:hypothetical protein
MSDALVWLENNWPTVVQAASAVVIVILTRRLTKATDAYARSAKDQVDELVESRHATIRPYLHVVNSHLADATTHLFDNPRLSFLLKNVGTGPAIDVVAALQHATLKFTSDNVVQTVGSAGDYNAVFTLQTPDTSSLVDRDPLQLVVEYRDLAGQWWATRTPATLTLEGGSSQCESKIEINSQAGCIGKIDQPSIRQPFVGTADHDFGLPI